MHYSRNPNAPSRKLFLTQDDLDWTEYDSTNKTYLSLGIPPKVSHHYRHKLMNFWNDHITDIFKNLPPNESSKNEERPEILPPEPYPRLPFFPFHPERNTDIITWHNGLPVFSSTPRPHVYGTIVKSENEKPRSASTGLLGVDNGFGSKYQQTSTSKETEVTTEVDADNSSSMAMSIVIVVGVCFLLVNLCAFAGLYYQHDRLKVQERLMKKRYEDVENTNNEDYYVRKLPEQQDDGENATLEKTDKKENKKKKAQASADELYEAVRSREKTLDGKDDMIEEEEAAKVGFKKWKLSRQCSTSTMDPHTKVREWIAHEIVQRCSPRFLRRTKFQQPTNRSMVQNDNSFDTFVEKNSSANAPAVNKNLTPSSSALSKPTTTTLQRSKVKKVSVAVDATPGARGASVLKQIPIEQMSKSMEEIGINKCVSTTEITLQQKKAALKRSETCRESLAMSSSSSDPNNRDTVLRRSTSINLQLYQPSNKIQNSGLSISHQHSKSDPVPHSTKQNLPKSSNVQNPQMTYISVDSKREPQDTYSTGLPQKQLRSFKSGPNLKDKTGKEVPISVMPISNICRDINVTSRDSCEKNEQLPHADPLKTIQRRNFPKVLPDLPSSQEINNYDQDSAMDVTPIQAISAKRRSLPPPLYLLVETEASESDAGSVSQPTTPTNAYQKDVNIHGQAGKVPPPPPPRISSTLGRKPNNLGPVAPISSSFDSQDSMNVSTSIPSAIWQQRQEPRFIIKPTSTAPVTRNPSLLQQGRAKQIPRVVPNSGEEYPLTPRAMHHPDYNTTSPSEISSSIPPLSRQNSIRNKISQPSKMLKTPLQSQVQPGMFEASKEKKHLQSFEEIHNLHKTLPTSYPSVPKELSSLEPTTHYPIKSKTQQHTLKTTPTQRMESSTTTPLQGKPTHRQKVSSKKSTETLGISSLSTEDTSSNTGTVRHVKKEIDSKNQGIAGNSNVEASSPTKTTAESKAWYAQYNQSFLSKSKDSDN